MNILKARSSSYKLTPIPENFHPIEIDENNLKKNIRII